MVICKNHHIVLDLDQCGIRGIGIILVGYAYPPVNSSKRFNIEPLFLVDKCAPVPSLHNCISCLFVVYRKTEHFNLEGKTPRDFRRGVLENYDTFRPGLLGMSLA